MPAPFIIGIAGPSCSGKTTLAKRLLDTLPGTATLLPLDAYYRDLSHLPAATRAANNFDAPEALDDDLLAHHLSLLAAGQPIERPVYSFAEHVRTTKTQRLVASDFIVVEGLFTLYWPQVRQRLDLRVFIEAPDTLCLARRSRRDVHERGRTPESVQQQYEATVRPMSQAHILPTRRHAQIQLHGDAPLDQLVESLMQKLPPAT